MGRVDNIRAEQHAHWPEVSHDNHSEEDLDSVMNIQFKSGRTG